MATLDTAEPAGALPALEHLLHQALEMVLRPLTVDFSDMVLDDPLEEDWL